MNINDLKRYYRILRSFVASVYHGFPYKEMVVIGVTGTSGKSTTSTMIYHLLKSAGLNVGLISTVGAMSRETKMDTGLHVTTPDPMQLQDIIARMKKDGVKILVVESSSHSLDQGRLGLIKFDYAVFTNIKRDHLDYHKTWENYAYSKARLIKKLKKDGKVFLNKDDELSFNFLSVFSSKINGIKINEYSASQECRVESDGSDVLKFKYNDSNFSIPIIGQYNVENALAAIKVAQDFGIDLAKLAEYFSTFETIEGRMQVMQKEPFYIIVDFAHNTDSLVRSLHSARKLTSKDGRVITVFGSAGLRDKEKRFTMGEASGKLADITVVTAEDSRTESLYEINSKIIEGAKSSGAKLIKRFKDHIEYEMYIESGDYKSTGFKEIYSFDQENTSSRYDAVDFAIKIARAGDVVITEGKGHEQSLCFGTTEFPFTDQDAVKKALSKFPL